MGVKDILRRVKRPEPTPEITATEARIIADTLDIVNEGLRPQEAYWPRHGRVLALLRRKKLMKPLDPGENPLCSTEVTSLGRKAWSGYSLDHDLEGK